MCTYTILHWTDRMISDKYFTTSFSRKQIARYKPWQWLVQHWTTHLKTWKSCILVHLTSTVVAQSCGVAALVCPLTVENTVTPRTNRAQRLSTQCLKTTGLRTHCTLSLWHIHYQTCSQQMWASQHFVVFRPIGYILSLNWTKHMCKMNV